ncbi:radical SAM family heme chaperone HemW [Bacteroides sp. 51]|uniref:radical SAM family heme chaperone HemW n=1 Tax=Bacteroides sp. 51 TaxID=2302938 RepID=UPI0013CFAA2B|nr:radical SAM family heme chaperone HemW [Bacteroides sp. 51]NDV81170.1 radical SAM family heme chaperone HemW [Bacteroides sp. 51]
MAGIYIHIPFCKTRCIYCDFYSTTQSELKERYIQALCKELELRKDYLNGEPIQTIYWGGGTPSQLQPTDFRLVFDTIHEIYGMEDCEEITLEANPDDLTPEYLEALSSLPFNRISIGIQTFNNETLRLLKRRHTAEQAIAAVQNARLAGFNNISIDLIYGLPGETPESWKYDLSQAIELKVEHLSAYHLIYEEGTPLYHMLKEREVAEVSEDNSLFFFSELTRQLSTAGYEHYEISNFCLPGKYSRHNSSYWRGIKYLGCGPSAHSFNDTSREWNIASIDLYIEGIESRKRSFEIETLNKPTRYNDLIITSIRTMWGLSLVQLKKEFGTDYLNYTLQNAEKYLRTDELIIEKDHLRLTPKGVFISDSIMSDLLWVD